MIKIQTRIYYKPTKPISMGQEIFVKLQKIKNVKKFFYFSVLQVYGRELLGKN